MLSFDVFIPGKTKKHVYSISHWIHNLKEETFQNCQYVIIKALLTGLFKFCVVKVAV